ncbi:hypothetical protein PR048_019640 [Dryococelus australis]|uniref:Uncharacterized protein n=1 Tax=Dryococelus australis TaxID=614101 RepID=A0ABQ9H402_9NEOP|nr:hypothetical protein PR048_019640 [Dryococelus australis]
MRLSDRYCSGVWSDMIIETKLMQSFKTNTGLTHGQGISDSVISTWIAEMMEISATHDICASLEEFCGILFSSSEMRPTLTATILGGAVVLYLADTPYSTKAAEQEQWYRMKKSSDINLNLKTEITNRQVPGDADLLIVTTAIDKFTVTVTGGDIDLALLLMAKTPPDRDIFMKTVANTKPDISSLPPTEGAAKQHSYGTYYQVQQWLGNELPPELWGTLSHQRKFLKLFSDGAPKTALQCGCKKASLKFSPVCHNCHGTCLNCKLENEDDNDEELELPPTLIEELDENVKENIKNEDKEYEPQPGPSHPKRSKLL